MTYTLRPHQEVAINRLASSFKSGNKRPVLQAACGFGKTLVSIDIIHKALKREKQLALKNNRPLKKIVFIVDRLSLIEQTAREFDKHLLDFGIIQGQNPRYDLGKPLLLASMQTWVKLTKKPSVSLYIIDEMHSEYKPFVEHMAQMAKPPFIGTELEPKYIGLSGTPWKKGLAKTWDDLIVTESTQELIDMGYLSRYVIWGTDDIDLDDIKITGGDYNEKALEERVNTRKIIGNIVKTWIKRGENRQTIMFCVNIAHSKSVCAEFELNGIPTGHIDCHTKPDERAELLNKHDTGEIKILSNCTVFSKGHDSPSTTCLILARPTKSLMLYVQSINRVLRVSPDGKEAIILDHSGTVAKLGHPTDIIITELDDGKKTNKKEQKKDDLERELKADKPCSNCGFMHNVFKCPNCGLEPKINPRVESIKAELKKLEAAKASPAEKRKKEHSFKIKQDMWTAFLAIGKNRGHSSHLFKDYYSTFPRGLDDNATHTTTEAMSAAKKFKQAKNIAWRFRK